MKRYINRSVKELEEQISWQKKRVEKLYGNRKQEALFRLHKMENTLLNKHLEKDIKESKKSIEEDKELEKTLGRMK